MPAPCAFVTIKVISSLVLHCLWTELFLVLLIKENLAYVEYPEAQTVLHLIYKTLVTLLIYKPLYLLILAQNKGKNG